MKFDFIIRYSLFVIHYSLFPLISCCHGLTRQAFPPAALPDANQVRLGTGSIAFIEFEVYSRLFLDVCQPPEVSTQLTSEVV
jgi:hypothetical protein